MSQKIDLQIQRTILAVLVLFTFSGCSFSFNSLEYQRGVSLQEDGHHEKAIKHYERVIKRAPESSYAIKSSIRAGEIYMLELKNYYKAINRFRHVVSNSKDVNEKIRIQERIANLYFSRLTDYEKAIVEFQKLLSSRVSQKKKREFKFKIAKCYFYLNNFYQARIELEDLLNQELDNNERYQALVFKGNIEMNTKQMGEAVLIYKNLMENFAERAVKDNVAMNLVLAFEEQDQFDKSIEILREMKEYYPDKEFLDEKIARLKQRKANLPGARGLKR